MANYRQNLPQLDNNGIFLTDGGIETTLIFHEGFDLPYFAAFDLLKSEAGRDALYNYFSTCAAIANRNGVGFVLESATWRASVDWAEKLGYTWDELVEANQEAIAILEDVRDEYETSNSKMVISGCIGPRGDGYSPAEQMTIDEAQMYHIAQIETFAQTSADMVTAITMTYTDEAIGLTQAAKTMGMPVAISFTVETDGRLPSGETLQEAIEKVDAVTDAYPAYYMINCAHPSHFDHVLGDEAWVDRIQGLRANASVKSHAELDEAEELDDGNPHELGHQYQMLIERLPNLKVLGGCCGTDHRHIEQICLACVPA